MFENRAKVKARFEKIAPRIRKQYGVSDEADVKAIDRAERELAECKGCTGEPCQKRQGRYFQPVITRNERGELWIPNAFCEHGERWHLRRECGRAQVPAKYAGKTFADYEISRENERVIKMAKRYVERKPQQGLYLFGECGAGKTFLAAIIAQEFMRDFRQVIFGDVPFLLDEIKRTFDGKGNAQDVLDRYCECDLLILDDIGAGKLSEWGVGQIYQIINRRYNEGKPVIVTSNFDLNGLEKRLASEDAFSAKRITSRLSEICILGFLGTKDRRKKS